MDVNKKLQDEIVITTYCGPQPPCNVDGVDYPDRVTLEQYKLLKDNGLNMVFGHEDLMNSPCEHLAFRALDICQELGLAYMVRDKITEEYFSLGTRHKDFRKLTEEEKLDLDNRFIESLNRYKDHPAFAGIVFVDEPGSDMFEGIRRGRDVFERVCPGKIFYCNLFPMYVTARQYQLGWEKIEQELDPTYSIWLDEKEKRYRPNIERFKHHFEKFLDKVDAKVASYDVYPYAYLEERVHNGIHIALWQQQQYVTKRCRELDKDFWQFLQCGGGWCNDPRIRITSFGEVQHQVSLALAYGAKGLQLYTGCFPNCCIKSPLEHSGIIDKNGNITEQYPFFQYAFMQVKAIQKYLVHATLKGMVTSGEYFGLLPERNVIDKVEWNDTIYVGVLPKESNIEIDEYKELKGVSATSQCLVSCFDNDGESVFLIVNNSPYAAADVTLKFDGNYQYEYIKSTVSYKATGSELKICALPAGENVLVRIVGKIKGE